MKPAGSRLGPYEILASIGAGGMGEVYRARDTRLDRMVAIKVISAPAALDPAFRERFDREARAISALDHPHICTLYDVGHEDGVDFLVMQLLEGETLADRLARAARPRSDPSSGTPSAVTLTQARGPLPIEQALRYAVEIASALDAAHRRGIVHRDLKPGNIILTKAGTRLLDFGLAKLAAQTVTTGFGEATRTVPLTSSGSIVGTLNYMPPEQLEGGPIDGRTDIFSFGAVLYEMLSGRRAFNAQSHAALIAAILNDEPPELGELADVRTTLPPSLHRALERVVRRCMARDPDERWQCAADLAAELRWIDRERVRTAGLIESDAPPVASIGPAAGDVRRWRIATAAAALLAAAAVAAWAVGRPATPQEPIAFDIAEDPARFEPFIAGPGLLAVSPDGRDVVIATGTGATGKLVLRSLDSTDMEQLPGTDGATQPFWSPDGKRVGFNKRLGRTNLYSVDRTSGRITSLADDAVGRGTWNSDGLILFARPGQGLFKVNDSGGAATALTALDAGAGEIGHVWPMFLMDGRRYLYLAVNSSPEKSAIVLGSLDSTERREVIKASSSFELSAGHLLFQRDGAVYAQPFDMHDGRTSGDAGRIIDGVAYNLQNGRTAFSASLAADTLVYVPGNATSGVGVLRWFDMKGTLLDSVTGVASRPRNHRVSPDGTRITVNVPEVVGGEDVYVIDAERNVSSRLTSDAADDMSAVWSPDGQFIYFASGRGGSLDIYRRASGGGGSDELVYASKELKRPTSVSRDGRFLLFTRSVQGQFPDIWALPLTGDKTPFAVIQGASDDDGGSLSPDGHWIAYTSNDLGMNQVYVEPFPAGNQRVRISTTSGAGAVWSPDQKSIYYLSTEGQLMAADVDVAAGQLRTQLPRELFKPPGLPPGARTLGYDGTRKRFLLMTFEGPAQTRPERRIAVHTNWPAIAASGRK